MGAAEVTNTGFFKPCARLKNLTWAFVAQDAIEVTVCKLSVCME